MAKKKTADTSPAAPAPEVKAAGSRRRATSKRTTAETVVEVSNDQGSHVADSTPTQVSAPDASASGRPTYDQIAEAAYLRYLNRGASDGRDFDDWLAAEQELKTR